MAKCPTCQQELPAKDLEGFDAFWAAYPLKYGKLDAQKAWKAMNPVDRARVMLDLVEERRFFGVTKDTIPQPPYAATYLRKRRWEDPLPTQTIPDPPRKPEPDGGVARRLVTYGDTLEGYNQRTHMGLAPAEARARLADLIKGIGK